jgi:XTP/dITP diphosphohydrolase
MKLVFATQNLHKLKEAVNILPSQVQLTGLKEIGCMEELPETGNTLVENALQKARYVYEKYGVDCFADDTGLEVDALGGRPGVYSARFAGPEGRSEDNILKLLTELKGESNRAAQFRTVIALYTGSHKETFEGIIRGKITENTSGFGGFGYDSVFIPEGYSVTFAEMTPEQKNSLSHRFIALQKLAAYLNTAGE